MSQDKNPKVEPTAETTKPAEVGGASGPPRPAARPMSPMSERDRWPPKKSSIPPPLPSTRKGSSALIGPARSPTGERPVRDQLPSEEISSSVLMPDESAIEQRRGRDVAELSSALLLEDPGETRQPTGGPRLPMARTSRPPPLPERAMRTSRPPPVASNPYVDTRPGLLAVPALTTAPFPPVVATPPPSVSSGASAHETAPIPEIKPPLEAPPLSPETPDSPETPHLPEAAPQPSEAPSLSRPPSVARRHLVHAMSDLRSLRGVASGASRSALATGVRAAKALFARMSRAKADAGPLRHALEKRMQAFAGRVQELDQRTRVSIAARRARYPRFLLGVATTGLAVGAGIAVLVVALARRGARDEDGLGSAPSTPSVPAPAESVAPLASAAQPPLVTPPASAVACAMAGVPRVVAPNAIVAAGIEARSFGEGIALGFAATENEAVAVRLDPSSLSASVKVTAESKDPIRRVTPMAKEDGSLALAVDSESKDDAPPLEVGASDHALMWRRPGSGVGGRLWPLDGESSVEVTRGAAQEIAGLWTIALAFRRGNAIGVGLATGRDGPTASGDISYLEGLGANVGSPAIALSRDIVLVAWADHQSQSDPWRLRWVRFRKGQVLASPSGFSLPTGGKGVQAISPGLAVLPGRRFLLVWTEGPAAGHEVRAVTVSEEGDFLGSAFHASNADTNAGQAQAAVTDAGRGVVAFLESTSTGFQVVAAPIVCGI